MDIPRYRECMLCNSGWGWWWGRLCAQAQALAKQRIPQAQGGPWDGVSYGDDGRKILFSVQGVIALAFSWFNLNWPSMKLQLESVIVWIG